MSKSNAWENALMLLVFNNTDAANIGDATGLRGSSVAGSLYVSLHTGDPGEAGSQTTNECAYTSYARVAVARSGAGWTVTGNAVTNAALIQFAENTGSAETATHFGVGVDASGSGIVLHRGALASQMEITTGRAPKFEAGQLSGTES